MFLLFSLFICCLISEAYEDHYHLKGEKNAAAAPETTFGGVYISFQVV